MLRSEHSQNSHVLGPAALLLLNSKSTSSAECFRLVVVHSQIQVGHLIKTKVPCNPPNCLLMVRKDGRMLQDHCYAADAAVQNSLQVPACHVSLMAA